MNKVQTLQQRHAAICSQIATLQELARRIERDIARYSPIDHTILFLRGDVKQVALSLGVTPGVVRKVRSGRAKSSRITAALKALARDREADALLRPMSTDELIEVRHGGRYYGVFALAARTSGLSHSAIVTAAKGITRNPLALAHVHAAMASMDGREHSAPYPFALSPEERACFGPGGKYHGVISRVARLLHTSPGQVSSVAHGRRKAERVMKAIRNEIARIEGTIRHQQERAKRDARYMERAA